MANEKLVTNEKIRVLPQALADMIAAGEVVERPASVMKELIENSIDAGATSITVEMKNGGISLMRVTDNGCGMSSDDAKRAFLRHATSKLRTEEDLAAIYTLGFRGEALAALAAVSRVELLTKEKGALAGTLLEIAASEVLTHEETGTPEGTTLVVRDLFFNVPARQKFLKKEVTEAAQIAAVVDRAALAHPEIAFRLIRDGREELTTAGDGNLQNVIYQIYGREYTKKMVPVDYKMGKVSVKGFVGKPEAARPNRNLQNFFLNGRYIKSRVFTSALEEALKNSVMTERFPVCVLNIEMDPRLIDINVHPAKLEVKFSDERPVYDAVYFAVQSALRASDERVALKLGDTGKRSMTKGEAPAQKGEQTFMRMSAEKYRKEVLGGQKSEVVADTPAVLYQTQSGGQKTKLDISYAAYMDGKAEEQPKERRQETLKKEQGGETLLAERNMLPHSNENNVEEYVAASFLENKEKKSTQEELKTIIKEEADKNTSAKNDEHFLIGKERNEERKNTAEKPLIPEFRIAGELYHTYIIVEMEKEMWLVDKHAAQERIYFEKLRKERVVPAMQTLLTPHMVSLSRVECAAAMEKSEVWEKLGFELEDFGGGAILIRAVPMDIASEDAESLVVEIIGKLLAGKRESFPDVYDELLHSIACKASMKGGQKNSLQDLEHLVEELLTMPDIRYCPHGRPVLISTGKSALEHQFMRS